MDLIRKKNWLTAIRGETLGKSMLCQQPEAICIITGRLHQRACCRLSVRRSHVRSWKWKKYFFSEWGHTISFNESKLRLSTSLIPSGIVSNSYFLQFSKWLWCSFCWVFITLKQRRILSRQKRIINPFLAAAERKRRGIKCTSDWFLNMTVSTQL